ncbi:C2H2-type zinc finger transcription factor [Mucor lusitanicus]|uniref:C2H2-type zinc finger transcription factor n=2 Tax=Mucor circinelloides f. lusitanicus TaxID=29924 RepID=A0A168K203_MUCCL|nr:C2H2-type zinc finger transcription factor [Mucor lusitanicus CBS 277.49]
MNNHNVYQFRVQIEDLPSLDFLLHMRVHGNELPRYTDLLREIQYHSKLNTLHIQDYYMIIQQDDSCKFKFNNDYGLQNALRAITEKSRLAIKLMKMHGKEPFHIIKPIVIRMNPTESLLSPLPSPTSFPTMRKDSGIFFEQDLVKFNTAYSNNKRKLPTLSNIITSPPIHWSPAVSNQKLPSLAYLLDSPQLAPIQMAPLSPVSASASPYTAANTSTMTYKKRARGGSVPHQTQFICEHVDSNGKACCQAFRRSYDLSRHQSIHMKNRPLCYCRACGKKFTRLDALRRHERIQGHK